MNNRNQIIFISLGVVAAIVVGILLFIRSVNLAKNSEPEQSQSANLSASQSASNQLIYTHPILKFSLQHPRDFQVVTYNEEDGAETVLIQNPATKKGFQIFISPYDEVGSITPAQIKKDIPDMVIEDSQTIILGGQTSGGSSTPEKPQKFEALIFFSRDESLGRTREVWFVHGGNLYQVTARADFDEELSKIMATFQF